MRTPPDAWSDTARVRVGTRLNSGERVSGVGRTDVDGGRADRHAKP
ncbi:hypothetical protein ABZU45_21295 [Streptomyces avermitilis]